MPTQRTITRARAAIPILAIVALAGLVGKIGADARWLSALGNVIATHNLVLNGVPFAAAGTSHWPNALVLGELIFAALQNAFGDRGLMVAQLAACAGALAVLSWDARASGASLRGRAIALSIAGIGALPSLAIVRAQMFSLVLFPVLLALLRSESRRPSRRIWLVLPLLALWSNLHGAAVLGVAVTLAYLLLERVRTDRVTALVLAVASPLALCATPVLLRTALYYRGLLTNVAAGRGAGMWGALSLSAPLDVILVLCALALALQLRRTSMRPWEWVIGAMLALATVHASRNGVWLLFWLVAPAARALKPAALATRIRLAPVLAPLAAGLLVVALVRGPGAPGAPAGMVARVVTLAHGTPVLATGGLDEQVALAGGRIWIGNPIDAFSRGAQERYLDWLDGTAGGRSALDPRVQVVLVAQGSGAQTLMRRTGAFRLVSADGRAAVYERRSSRSPRRV